MPHEDDSTMYSARSFWAITEDPTKPNGWVLGYRFKDEQMIAIELPQLELSDLLDMLCDWDDNNAATVTPLTVQGYND